MKISILVKIVGKLSWSTFWENLIGKIDSGQNFPQILVLVEIVGKC